MSITVTKGSDGHRLCGDGAMTELANCFLAHLSTRGYSPGTVRGYAFDLANFARFLAERGIELVDVVPTDLFDYLDWQGRANGGGRSSKVVSLAGRRRPAPATVNRRIAAVRGLFEYAVITGVRADSPVPAARRSSGLRAPRSGLLGHLGPGRPRGGGRLVREPRRLPESLDPGDVGAFLSDLGTHRHRDLRARADSAEMGILSSDPAMLAAKRARSVPATMRWPPLVRRTGRRPVSAQRRTVSTLTPSSSAACPIR